MLRGRRRAHPEDGHHHALHLRLLGPAVAAHRLLHPRGRVLSALEAEGRGSEENDAARLADGERGTGVDADEGLLEHDGVRAEVLDQFGDAVEDRLEPQLGTALRWCFPPAVVDRLEAASAFVDDAVPARCRTRIDAENPHAVRLRTAPDVPSSGGRTLKKGARISLKVGS